jgi:hypothetical protein
MLPEELSMKARVFVAGLSVVTTMAVATVMAQNPPAAGQAPAPKKAAAATPASCGPTPPATLLNVAKGGRCFEMRTYTIRPGGQGDLNLLHKRFREATLPAFKRAGMEVVGFWQPVNKPDQLVYVMAYKDAAARDAAWAAFQADPLWVKARSEMVVDLTVTSEFMVATDYAPVK